MRQLNARLILLNINSTDIQPLPIQNHSINIPHHGTLKASKVPEYIQLLKEAQQSYKTRRSIAIDLDKEDNNKIRVKDARTSDDIIEELIIPYQYLEGQLLTHVTNACMR